MTGTGLILDPLEHIKPVSISLIVFTSPIIFLHSQNGHRQRKEYSTFIITGGFCDLYNPYRFNNKWTRGTKPMRKPLKKLKKCSKPKDSNTM